jgi:hypothetical protein
MFARGAPSSELLVWRTYAAHSARASPEKLLAMLSMLLFRILSVAVAGVAVTGFQADAQAAANAPHYRVVFERAMDSGGGLGELAIDSESRRLYGIGSKVVDLDKLVVVDSMALAMGHGFAFAPELNRAVSRRGVVFQTQSHVILRPGANHSARTVAYDARTKLAAINYDTLLILDVASTRVRSTVLLGPSSYVVADGVGNFYVSLRSDTLVVIDAKRATIRQRWGLGSCQTPAGMVIDQLGKRLLISCRNQRLIVLDYHTGHIVTELSAPSGEQIAFDPMRRLLFIPTERDTLTVLKEIDSGTFRIVEGVPVGKIQSAVAVDPRSGMVYLVRLSRQPEDPATIVLLALSPNEPTQVAH